MNIEFLFTDINDKSKLYLEEIYKECWQKSKTAK